MTIQEKIDVAIESQQEVILGDAPLEIASGAWIDGHGGTIFQKDGKVVYRPQNYKIVLEIGQSITLALPGRPYNGKLIAPHESKFKLLTID